jgi:hypothetical protein
MAEVFFWVEIPENTPDSEAIQLVLMDEVTGLPFNQKRMDMIQIDPNHYGVAVQAELGSVIKYRYERKSEGYFQEYNLSGEPVRYRMYLMDGPGETHDQVARWYDTPPLRAAGRMMGHITDKTTGEPLPDILIIAGGSWALTTADGTFTLSTIQEGQHNLIAYALDGSHQTQQQMARVAPDAATYVSLELEASIYKDVTFVITVPENTVQGAPIRFAGNLFQLGNTFSFLDGGMSGLVHRMPQLNPIDDGRYAITLKLPTGIDIRYKYTLGDGFWNAEHLDDFGFRVRRLFLPEDNQPILIEDDVITWQSGNSNPILFDVTVPMHTPESDEITIQFNLSGWTPPIPMWPVGNYHWAFLLLSPFNIGEALTYRYCRNSQCGQGFDFGAEVLEAERRISLYQNEMFIAEDTVTGWHYLNQESTPAVVLGGEITSRGPTFIKGINLYPDYLPGWGATLSKTLETIKSAYANLVVFTPAWRSISGHPPILFEYGMGEDYFYDELVLGIETAHALGLQAAVYPHVRFPDGIDEWWRSVLPSEVWWQIWLEQYRSFIIHYAMLAEKTHAEALILGGDWLTPTLPGPSGYDHIYTAQPGNINNIWTELIQDIRGYYHGTIVWHLEYDQLSKPPHTVYEVDQVYIHWGVSLANGKNTPLAEIQLKVEELLDREVKPFSDAVQKPIILEIAYPSAEGGATYHLPLDEKETISTPFEALSPLNPDIPSIELDLIEQSDIYNAILSAINERAWIDGVVSEGFFPPLRLEDKSTSIHGKPAQEILRYWFSHFIGN